jgi:PAS domain S-box-containing protein
LKIREKLLLGNAIPFPSNARKGAVSAPRGLPLSSVPRIARVCALGLVFDELLDEVCREILALSGADGGCLFLCAEDWVPERVRRAGASGTPSDVASAYRPGPALDQILDRLRAEGAVRADDLARLPESDPLRRLLSGSPVRSALLVPLRFGTRLPGFLALHVTGSPRPWAGEVLTAMDLVATILSAALERRRMEDRLRASEARYRFLAESSPDLISLHEPSGRFLYASPASLRILGIRPELMAGSPVEGFLHPDDVETVLAENRRVLDGGGGMLPLLLRMRRADGGFVEVESLAIAIPGEVPGELRVLRVSRDVTERRMMEARLRESQRLSAIGTLAGGVAHEFNNLMAGIQGAAEMLSLAAGEEPRAREYLDVILRMGGRAVELTHQLLAYSRQGKYAPAVLSLRSVVNETASLLRPSLPPAVELAVSVEEGLPPVFADAAQLRQVVMGLCLNAAEAMPEGGKVTVRAGREDGSRLVLQVRDTGVGMGEETKARAFEPFFSTKNAGRGMGLAAIRGIVENHGGEIRVDSRPGEGSTFSVLLPASAERRKSDRHAARAPRPASGKILLADDEPDVRAVVRAMLESLGYTVAEAKDGREAVELFRGGHAEIDLVLLDQRMPRLTGEAALAEMRKIAPGVRAILASGYDESDRIREIVAAGFGGFLQKPFRREELSGKIAEILASSLSGTE